MFYWLWTKAPISSTSSSREGKKKRYRDTGKMPFTLQVSSVEIPCIKYLVLYSHI